MDNEQYDNTQYDVVIVGGGAAGLSAALMLGRARRRVVVVDAGQPRNRFASHMHGVLGHEGLPPSELIAKGRTEVAAYGVEFVEGEVVRLDGAPDATEITVTLAEGGEIRARAAILTMGLTDELPDVPGLAARWGRTVLHCPYCHGWEVRGQRLGVLATSPMALHQVQLVRQWSDDVVFFAADAGPLAPDTLRRLRSRGIRVVTEPVVEIQGDGDDATIDGVRTADGSVHQVDAVFTAGTLRPHAGFLAHLGLDHTDGSAGPVLAVDLAGRTSHPRIWAAGNVNNPMANVPLAIGSGSMAGAAVNAALVEEEFDAAAPAASWEPDDDLTPAEFWEQRYAGSERIWSGRHNAALEAVTAELTPGRMLDLGCGEGGDSVWLAQQGWDVTGVDISPTATTRAHEAAVSTGVADRTTFVAADLSDWTPPAQTFDLVSACFLQSMVELPRTDILRRAADAVAPGGRLLVVSHAAPPPWADLSAVHKHDGMFLSPTQELEALDLPDEDWHVEVAEVRPRKVTAPDGTLAAMDDTVLLLRRA